MPDANDTKYVCGLDEATMAKAKRELFEEPAETQSKLNKLREWVTQHPGITCRTDNEFLIRFLRRCKFSITSAQNMIEKYCIIRASEKQGVPKWFKNTNPYDESILEVLDSMYQTPLPVRAKNGEQIIYIRVGAWDPKREDMFDNVFRYSFMAVEVLLRDEATQVNGFQILCDFTDFSLAHATYWTRETIQNAMKCWQDVYPTRNKGIHYYKTPAIFNAIFEIIKYFAKEKMKQRIHLHTKKEALLEYFSKECLPKELGGTAGKIKDINQKWKEQFFQNKPELDLLNKIKVDDNNLDVKFKSEAEDKEMLGVQGSFRKLDVD